MSQISDHRSDVLNLLRAYHPLEEKAIYKERMIAFIEQNPDCFERSLASGHMTASAWLVNNQGTHALLMHHAKIDKWVQPGGHCDGNPDVLNVAIKEAQEESGIHQIVPISPAIFDLDIHKFPEKGNIKEHFHYDIRFLLQVTSDETLTKNHESKELLWVNKDIELLPTKSRSVVRMFMKWLDRST